MKNETTFTEAIEYLEKHVGFVNIEAKKKLKILSDFIEEQFKTEKFEKRKKKAIKRQVKLYEKARLDVANTNGIMIDSYVLEWFMADAFLPFQNAKKVLRGLYNGELSNCSDTWLFDKKFALDVVDDGKVIFANDLTRINIYKLFIDDERFPTTPDWFVARTSEQSITAVKNYGFPKEIAFDHDLGNDDTAINFLNFLPNYFIDNDCKFPVGFKYSIHSQNPVGKENIDSKMKQLLKYFS